MTPNSSGPLAGIRILDFTRVLSGPYCTALLADLGAEVVKVEAPAGDDYRHIGPFRDGESALFQLVNRNKSSVVLDMKTDQGRALARDLALASDVVIENFRPGVAARLGIDADSLMAEKPSLVYASISGFGQTGASASLPAFDLVAQAMSGMMALTGEADGQPTKVGESVGDLAAGLFASWAVLAALLERQRTGQGRKLDIAMVDSLVALLPTAVAQWGFGNGNPTRVGNRHPLSTPFGTYQAQDGHLVICVLNSPQFTQLCQIIGQPDMATDPRFATDELRTSHEPLLREAIEDWLASRSVAEAVSQCGAAGVPAAAVLEAAEVLSGDHVRDRGVIGQIIHPRLGTIPAMEQPVHFAGLARGNQRPAPDLGADTDEVLSRWLGDASSGNDQTQGV